MLEVDLTTVATADEIRSRVVREFGSAFVARLAYVTFLGEEVSFSESTTISTLASHAAYCIAFAE